MKTYWAHHNGVHNNHVYTLRVHEYTAWKSYMGCLIPLSYKFLDLKKVCQITEKAIMNTSIEEQNIPNVA